jgi:Dullard-like phosphatase family protein
MTVKFRPYVREFISNVKKYYNLAVFTASAKEYATQIVNSLDPNQEYISNVLFRDHCTLEREGSFVKDLRSIVNIDLSRTVIVDNKLISFAYQIENGIPILPFYGDKNDTELKYLL